MLNLASTGNSPDRSTKSTRSHLNVLPQLVNTGFQVLFHSPPGVLFTFPSQYYALSVTKEYLALEGGQMCIRDRHRPVFLLNSCLSLFSAATSLWHPFSRSYGVILPSSLTMLLPPALGFSPHLPVSVYGTGMYHTIAAFLDSRNHTLRYFSSLRVTSLDCQAGLPT